MLMVTNGEQWGFYGYESYPSYIVRCCSKLNIYIHVQYIYIYITSHYAYQSPYRVLLPCRAWMNSSRIMSVTSGQPPERTVGHHGHHEFCGDA